MNRWEVDVCEFTCHQLNVGTFTGVVVVSAQIAFLYCDLISPQFVGSQYVRCLRTFVHPTTYCNNIFENVITCPWRNDVFRTYVLRYFGRRVSDPTSNLACAYRSRATFQARCRMVVLSIYKYLCRRLRHAFIMKDPLLHYYLQQAGCGSHSGIRPIYSVPPFMQRGHGLGSFVSGLLRLNRAVLWSEVKAVGRENYLPVVGFCLT